MISPVKMILRNVLTKCLPHSITRHYAVNEYEPKKPYTTKEKCWRPICGLSIRKIPYTNSEKCRVATFLAKHYFPSEPILMAGGLSTQTADAALLQYLLSALNDDRALYAEVQESREILGVAIARTTTPTTVYELRTLADKMADEKARRYIHLLSQVEDRTNIYNTFQINQALSLEVLAVNKLFRRRGVAKKLLEGMTMMARQYPQYPLLRFTSANHYASIAARKCGGLKPYYKRLVTTYKDARGKPWIKRELCSPHKEIEVFTKNLRLEAKRAAEAPETKCDRYGLEKHDKIE